MADIDVVRDDSQGDKNVRKPVVTGGARLQGHRRSPWGWLIPLLLVAIVGAWFFADRNRRAPDRDVVATSGTAGGTIASIAGLNARTTAGRRVELQNARVSSVVGDRTFWVSDGSGNRALVVLNEQLSQQSERQLQVKAGQQAHVTGIAGDAATVPQGLDAADQRAVREAGVFVSAERVSVTGQ